ncbi:helix-turn-helix transcriptional regulator [Lysobacter arenosi]|uniref:Helix-turn-helix transcriptional regulator n=1 Tax=Lysobacter arenosi TaxID=2795387 RepID=A0ABX7RER9_9GAMM|nr:winged helix-turn-helix domain-containing protein [Lysobacter arenosi]QSX75889.1 helix-turn-helix transcriptional regulator [Lysobacter arenosi]
MSCVFEFGPFRLCPTTRVLQQHDGDVALGSRAFDILVALVESNGNVLTRRELMAIAWPGLVVEESNVRVQVANLRKVLGCGRDGARYIASIAGRGYCFAAPVQRTATADEPPAANARGAVQPQKPLPHLPAPLERALGREESVEELSRLLPVHRLITVAGAAGAGKTTLAVLVAHAAESFGDSIHFIDLSIVTSEDRVLEAVATAIGYMPSGPVELAGLIDVLSTRRTLLVLDNCEHLIGAVADLCVHTLEHTGTVHFLNTSREALRLADEHVYLLRPLGSPPGTGRLTAEQALAWPAVQLFVDRAREGGALEPLSDEDAPTVAAICRRLDGNPLAIGLVASRVGAYGIQGVSDLLASQFALLWQGRRDAIPRHQSVEALIAWSHDLLPQRDRIVLYRLSVFAGAFPLESAIHVIADDNVGGLQAGEAICDLVDKSLIVASSIDGETHVRLLETTRAYAVAKLATTGDAGEVASRHARYYAEQLREYSLHGSVNRTGGERPRSPDIGNVRVAMDWCFAARHDVNLGVEMSRHAASLFLEHSLLNECKRCCERALAAMPEHLRSTDVEMSLLESLAVTCYIMGDYDGEMTAIVEKGLATSIALDDVRATFRFLAGLHLAMMSNGRFPESLLVSERYASLAAARGGPREAIVAAWMSGSSNHYTGRQLEADESFARGTRLVAEHGVRQLVYFEMKEQVIAIASMARVKWVRGFPLQALEVARRIVDDSRRHPDSLYISVVLCFPIFLQNKLDNLAELLIQELAAVANEYKMGTRLPMGHYLKGHLLLHRGRPDEAAMHLRQCLEMLRPPKLTVIRSDALQAFAESLRQLGDGAGALDAINEAIGLAEQTGGVVNLADMLRAKAEVMRIVPGTRQTQIEQVLSQAMACAKSQGALEWEMSVALAMAEGKAAQGRRKEAKGMLESVYSRFTEGFDTGVRKATAKALEGL